MGLIGDITSKVITTYSANADAHIDELKKLKKNITDAQKAELDAHESRKSTYDGWMKGLTGVNQGLELVGKAVAIGREAFKAYSDDLRLRTAAGSVSIDKLKAASLGLRTEHELLSFAAKAQNGAFKLTQDQMEMTQRAMIGLTRAGFDQEEVTKKVTDAIVKLEGDGLKDFGIRVKQGTTDTEKFSNVMAALAEKATGVNEGTVTAAEGVDQMGASMSDSIDHMKVALGELVVAMTPLLKALASAVGLIADLTVATGKDINWIDAGNKAVGRTVIERDKESASAIMQLAIDSKVERSFEQVFGAFSSAAATKYAASLPKPVETTIEMDAMAIKRRGGKAGPGKFSDVAAMAGMSGGTAGVAGALGASADSTQRDMYGNEMKIDTSAILAQIEALNVAVEQVKGPTLLERLGLHNPSEMEMASGVLASFTSSYASSMQALGESSESGAQIAKHMFAEVIRGLGGQLAAKGAAELVEGSALLLTGNPAGFGHLGAAALYSGGAVAAYAAASKIDGGGGASAPAKGSGASSGASSSGGSTGADGRDHRTGASGPLSPGSGKETTVVVYADAFADASPRQRRAQAERIVQRVNGGMGYSEG